MASFETKTTFAFFGCWNETEYSPDKPKQTKYPSVLKAIENKNVDFLVVAGDNYYSKKEEKTKEEGKTKEKKTKKVITEDLTDGFKALIKINKPTYLLLGNHDIESTNNCEILKTEKNKGTEGNLFLFDYTKYPENGYRIIEKHTLLIMLDTNIFDTSIDPTCYSVLEKGSLDLQELREKQKKRITSYIEKEKANIQNIKNICFFGHHPIMCFKQKSGKVKPEAIPEINDFLFDIVSEINNKTEQNVQNIYYFSAHLHQYQSGEVTLTRENQGKQEKITIHQYISGTGGAHLDPEIKITESDTGILPKSYKMEKSIESHGFSLIDINSDGKLKVDFIEIKTGGKKTKRTKKTRRTRRKTRKTKKSKRI
jgi:DNA repair exonuclease SbcCD nuclease subunit